MYADAVDISCLVGLNVSTIGSNEIQTERLEKRRRRSHSSFFIAFPRFNIYFVALCIIVWTVGTTVVDARLNKERANARSNPLQSFFHKMFGNHAADANEKAEEIGRDKELEPLPDYFPGIFNMRSDVDSGVTFVETEPIPSSVREYILVGNDRSEDSSSDVEEVALFSQYQRDFFREATTCQYRKGQEANIIAKHVDLATFQTRFKLAQRT